MSVLLLALASMAPAHAGPFVGAEAYAEMGINQVTSDPFDDANFFSQIPASGFVGPTVECLIIDPWVWVDFSDVDNTVTLGVNTSWAALPFNGIRMEFPDPGSRSMEGATLLSTNITGLTMARVSTQGSRLAVDFGGMSSVGTATFTLPDGPELEVSGTCPGGVQVDLSNMTPGGSVILVKGAGPGDTPVPVGPCAGSVLFLDTPRVLARLTADGAGEASLSGTVPAGICGTPLQAIDVTTCVVTPAGAVP